MSEFHDDYPQYELMTHHSEEEGKIKRKKLWNVFWIMFGVTILELVIAAYANKIGFLEPGRTSGTSLKFVMIALTLVNAVFTLFSFMHLGQQKKAFKYSIVAPYLIFIFYLIFIVITESIYSEAHKSKTDDLFVKQKAELNAAAASGHNESEVKP